MIRKIYARIVLIVLTASCGIGLATSAFADAKAESHGNGKRVVRVRSNADGGIGACDPGQKVTQNVAITDVCFRTGNAGANIGYASAKAGPGRVAERVAWTKGSASAGLGTSAVADTACYDSVRVSYVNTGANQTTLTISGLVFADGARSSSSSIHRVILYPDSATANLDVNSTGAGALFNGAIHISASTSKPAPDVSYSGGFISSDFTVTTQANRVSIRATGLNKVVNAVPDTGKVVVRGYSDATSTAVPGISPVLMGLLALMLGGAAFVMLRRQGAETVA